MDQPSQEHHDDHEINDAQEHDEEESEELMSYNGGSDDEEYYTMCENKEEEEEEKLNAAPSSSLEHEEHLWSSFNYYQNHDDYRDYFEPTYYSHSLSKTKKSYPENGDKVIMPVSALDSLVHLDIDYPMLFEIENYSTGKASHCGVLEFTAEEGSVLLPNWMMENLQLEEGDLVNIKNVSLEKATYLKLQPHSMEFIAVADPKFMLEQTLRNFTCLSSGDTLLINHDNKSFYLTVLETKPSAAVSVNETDCEVDFAPPLDCIEKPKPKPEQPAPLDMVEGTSRAFESKLVLNKRRGKVVFGSNGIEAEAQNKLRKLSRENTEAETSSKGEEKFQPFTGKKCSLLDC